MTHSPSSVGSSNPSGVRRKKCALRHLRSGCISASRTTTDTSLPDMLPHHQGGKLKIIGVASAERSPLLKEAQTLKEAGVDFVAETNIDIYGPPGMAPDVVKKLNEQITAAMTSAETRAKLSSYGVVIVTSTPEQLARIAVDELKMWEGPVKASGYQGD